MTQPSHASVAIHIVAWNGMTHLPSCLASVAAQHYSSYQVMVVDNGSLDNTVTWLQAEYPQFHLLRNTRNLGFCRGHNQALRLTESTYVLCLNQDVVLTPDWLERAVATMELHPEIGALGGKLLRFSYSDEELKSVVPSAIIDSAGLRLYRTRHVNDRGIGETDHGQYNRVEPVFGLSGACVLFRRQALETIRFQNEYFDEDFFAYKDDIDIARRLLRRGWTNWYDGTLTAYHFRSIRGQATTKNLQIAKNFRKRQSFNELSSYRNHWLCLMKHEHWSSIRKDLPWIMWYEFRKFIFLLFTKPSTLTVLRQVVRLRPRMIAKRRLIDQHAVQAPEAIRTWFTRPT